MSNDTEKYLSYECQNCEAEFAVEFSDEYGFPLYCPFCGDLIDTEDDDSDIFTDVDSDE